MPALGVVLLSVLLEEILLAMLAFVVAAGILLSLFIGAAAMDGLQKLF